mmetsp:Transcript_34298/g.79297  ORF Transcript_34298/g.79297 Transcript_34298/m.79297 type:complete len:205 (-) Transcript_34298:334-948(-)
MTTVSTILLRTLSICSMDVSGHKMAAMRGGVESIMSLSIRAFTDACSRLASFRSGRRRASCASASPLSLSFRRPVTGSTMPPGTHARALMYAPKPMRLTIVPADRALKVLFRLRGKVGSNIPYASTTLEPPSSLCDAWYSAFVRRTAAESSVRKLNSSSVSTAAGSSDPFSSPSSAPSASAFFFFRAAERHRVSSRTLAIHSRT